MKCFKQFMEIELFCSIGKLIKVNSCFNFKWGKRIGIFG